mmetsp:Transcript_2676/g.4111  ORF Transcript_2676/g.4111 Transcript_2676/m.4111 type:complete len:313 (-) Transcript_2676:1302-2240(-)
MVLIEIMGHTEFFKSATFRETLTALQVAEEVPLPPGLTEAQSDLISSILQKDPLKRPSIDDILSHTALADNLAHPLPVPWRSETPPLSPNEINKSHTTHSSDNNKLSVVTAQAQKLRLEMDGLCRERDVWVQERQVFQQRIEAIEKERAYAHAMEAILQQENGMMRKELDALQGYLSGGSTLANGSPTECEGSPLASQSGSPRSLCNDDGLRIGSTIISPGGARRSNASAHSSPPRVRHSRKENDDSLSRSTPSSCLRINEAYRQPLGTHNTRKPSYTGTALSTSSSACSFDREPGTTSLPALRSVVGKKIP